ncbi:ABC transporter permease, partial [bacterium]|nr:ABC transporter permease [bacterium]
MDSHPPISPKNPESARGASLGQIAWRRLRRNRLAMAGMVFLGILIVLSILTPFLTSPLVEDPTVVPYNQQNLRLGPTPPSVSHWLGTDQLGRDALTRILYGGRVSLLIGIVATGVSVLIGVLYGSISGFAGGRTDGLLMRLVDILYALPFPIFVIILMVFFWRHVLLLFLAIGAVEWLTMARIVRGQILSLK